MVWGQKIVFLLGVAGCQMLARQSYRDAYMDLLKLLICLLDARNTHLVFSSCTQANSVQQTLRNSGVESKVECFFKGNWSFGTRIVECVHVCVKFAPN